MCKSVFHSFCWWILISLHVTVLEAQVSTIESSKANTVWIQTNDVVGAGVVVGDSAGYQYIITAKHVVDGVKRGSGSLKFYGNEISNRFEVVKKASQSDLAVLRTKSQSIRFLPFEKVEFESLSEGDLIQSIGHPYEKPWLFNKENHVQKVCNPTRSGCVLETSKSSILPGCSGGPVLDDSYAFVGMMLNYDGASAQVLRSDIIVEILRNWRIPYNYLDPSYRKKKATVILHSKEACIIQIDGKKRVSIERKRSKTFQLEPGIHHFEAFYFDDPSITWQDSVFLLPEEKVQREVVFLIQDSTEQVKWPKYHRRSTLFLGANYIVSFRDEGHTNFPVGFSLYGPIGCYVQRLSISSTETPGKVYTQQELMNAQVFLQNTGAVFEPTVYSKSEYNFRGFQTGVYFSVFRHLYLKAGISSVNGSTWEVHEGELGNTLESLGVSLNGKKQYPTNYRNFSSTNWNVGVAFVVPYLQVEFEYDHLWQKPSILLGANYPIKLLKQWRK